MNAVAAWILALPPWVALLVVFLLPALEASFLVGFIFPGEIALVLGGVLAFQHAVPLWAVLVAGVAGAIAGDSAGYAFGRRWGGRLIHSTVGRLINRRHLDRGERYLAERGGKAVFIGRFTAALRVMMPGLAGMAGMRYRTFLAYNVAGGVSWGTLCVLLGYLGGSSWQRVSHLASRIGLVAIGVIALLIIIGYLLRRARWGWLLAGLDRVRRSRAVVWFRTRFPRATTWIVARLDARRSDGLALTAVVAIAVSAIWVTAGLTQDVLAHEEIATVDPAATGWIIRHRYGWISAVMRAATWLGSGWVLVPVLIIGCVLFRLRRRSWLPTVDIAVVYLWATISYAVLKDAVHRPRPATTDWLAAAGGWAFPSGHTTQAMAGWGVLCIVAWAGRPVRTKIGYGAGAAVIILLVAFSRWYLGVHWLTDVLAGLAIGTAILALWSFARITFIADWQPPVVDGPEGPAALRTPVSGSGPARSS